jgi:molecular chaperone DnaJ
MSKDYYSILGVDKKVSKDELKKAFRKMAHKYHPDKKDGDETKFKEVNEAYSILSDEKKRAEYDAYGRVFSGGGTQQNAGAGFGGFDFNDFVNQQNGFGGTHVDFGDIFGDIFNGFGGQGGSKRGRDISMDIELSFEESIFGTERTVLVSKTSTCDECKGIGAQKDTEQKNCEVCGGKGKVHETRNSFLGTFSTIATCGTCHGRGTIPEKPCEKCKGSGVHHGQTEIKMRIPAGIENGEMIRLTGQGEAVSGGTSGDLYAKIHIKKDSVFTKEGDTLKMKLNVKLTDALLGNTYSVKTLDGMIDVGVPSGVSHGEQLRVRGKGVPKNSEGGTKGKRGDLLLEVVIKIPEKLSKKAKKLFEDLREEGI